MKIKNLTRERALELHRQMWGDMQRDLGDEPRDIERIKYKAQWCHKHFPTAHIDNDCFLCKYVSANDESNCVRCPIKWPNESKADGIHCYCTIDEYYYKAPISEILALPEREDVE